MTLDEIKPRKAMCQQLMKLSLMLCLEGMDDSLLLPKHLLFVQKKAVGTRDKMKMIGKWRWR